MLAWSTGKPSWSCGGHFRVHATVVEVDVLVDVEVLVDVDVLVEVDVLVPPVVDVGGAVHTPLLQT